MFEEYIRRHRRAVVMRRDDEHSIRATRRGVLGQANRVARRFRARANDQRLVLRENLAGDLDERRALGFVEQRGFTGRAGDHDATQAGVEMSADVERKRRGVDVTVRCERRDERSEDSVERDHGCTTKSMPPVIPSSMLLPSEGLSTSTACVAVA